MSGFIRINPSDNVAVALEKLSKGQEVLGITLLEDIPAGHKFSLKAIPEGEDIVKYAFPIGHATCDIPAGSWVHTHNVKTNLSGVLEYAYHPHACAMPRDREASFLGYRRKNGKVGIRNEVWIVNTVGCVNATSKTLERLAQEKYGDRVDGIHCSSPSVSMTRMTSSNEQVLVRQMLASMPTRMFSSLKFSISRS